MTSGRSPGGVRVTRPRCRRTAATGLVPSTQGPPRRRGRGPHRAHLGAGMKDYVAPQLTVVGTLEELTGRSDVGPTSDMPLAHQGTVFTVFS